MNVFLKKKKKKVSSCWNLCRRKIGDFYSPEIPEMIRKEDWEKERRHHEICLYVRIDTFEKYILLYIQKMTSKLQLLNVLERQALLF